MPRQLPTQGSGTARPENTIIVGNARFTILDTGMLRLEYAQNGAFENRASYFAVDRTQAPQVFSKQISENTLQIKTAKFQLTYRGTASFSAQNLMIEVSSGAGNRTFQWKPGTPDSNNLGGTIRTLDEVGGPMDLGKGLLSKDGWCLIDDSNTVLFTDEVVPWALSRPDTGNFDWYFFAYGHDYKAALKNLCSVGGKIPLPPKFALGSWYSRYWPYTSDEFLEIADQYKRHGFPLDVMVIDMDWHEDGWTGYTWNRKLIEDPKALLAKLHALGLKVTLNLHPHDGVGSHEAAYSQFRAAMGLSLDSHETVPFDITDKKFAEGYFRILLNPLEEDGVDFWWMDWQQGSKTKIEGLDPLMWLNHLHFRDRERDGNAAFKTISSPIKRGLNFSRWGGLGDHRYPVHFSGDTHSNWEVLEFLAPFTATAGNVGAAYWSHDMGGHFATSGRTNPELFTRWIQFGAFSPVLRVHSSRDKDNDRRPWLYGEPFTSALRQAYVLRDQLTPYLYATARQCYDSGIAPLRPMYIQFPELARAYEVPNQFMFGEDILVAPASRPGFGTARVVHVPVWFPEGLWYHILTHERFQGPMEIGLALPLDAMAVFVRGGAPIAMKGDKIRLYPGASASRAIYDDDGESVAYQEKHYRDTAMASVAVEGSPVVFTLGPSQGDYAGAAAKRPAMILELPLCQDKTVVLPEATLDHVTRIEIPTLRDAETDELYSKVFRSMEKARIAQSQLKAGHSLTIQAQKLRNALEQLLESFNPREDRGGLMRQFTETQKKSSELIALLAQSPDEGSQDALRVLAGISMHVLACPGTDPSMIRLEVEVRREAGDAMHATLRLGQEKTPLTRSENISLGAKCLEILRFDWPIEYGRLGDVDGIVELELVLSGHCLTFREAFHWNARTVREWLVLGPVIEAKGPSPATFSKEIATEIVYPRVAGGSVGWQWKRFDPQGVMRAIRETYDFGETFFCPEGECFAATFLEASEAGIYSMTLGHEGKACLWVNGIELNWEGSSYQASLLKGRNLVVIRLRQMKRKGGGFALSVAPAGRNLYFKVAEAAQASVS